MTEKGEITLYPEESQVVQMLDLHIIRLQIKIKALKHSF